jgi:hypothetical protein
MKAGDLVNHIMKGGYGIGIIVGIRLSQNGQFYENAVYNVMWRSTGTIGWAWDYDLEVISEGRRFSQV